MLSAEKEEERGGLLIKERLAILIKETISISGKRYQKMSAKKKADLYDLLRDDEVLKKIDAFK